MKYKLLIILGIIGVILLAGCVAPASPKETQFGNFRVLDKQTIESETSTSQAIVVVVIHDDERNVTCWANWQMTHGGISCLPDSQINQHN